MPLFPAPERRKKIFGLGLPIIAGMMSQNVLNVVDTAMVGTLGDVSLAAVGMGGFAIFMSVALIMGLSAGVQAISARRLGEGRHDQLAVPLNAALVLALICAIPWAGFLIWWTPEIFGFLVSDPAVVDEGVPYVEVRLLAMLGVFINYAFRGYWNGINQPGLYMRTIIVQHLANIVLNYALIFGHFGAPTMGSLGAGVASTIATYLGSAIYLVLGLRLARENGFLRTMPSIPIIASLLRLTIPAGSAQFSLAAGYTALMWIVGMTGTGPMAVANVLLTITVVAILPGLAFGWVAASLVGQSLGRGDPDDAEAWGWDVVKTGSLVMAIIGLPMIFVPDLLLSGFLHDPSSRALGIAPLQLVGVTIGLDGIGLILMNALYGAGASRRVFIVGTSLQWGVGLPLAYLFGPILGWGLLWMWIAITLYRLGQTVVLSVIWRGRSWTRIEV